MAGRDVVASAAPSNSKTPRSSHGRRCGRGLRQDARHDSREKHCRRNSFRCRGAGGAIDLRLEAPIDLVGDWILLSSHRCGNRPR